MWMVWSPFTLTHRRGWCVSLPSTVFSNSTLGANRLSYVGCIHTTEIGKCYKSAHSCLLDICQHTTALKYFNDCLLPGQLQPSHILVGRKKAQSKYYWISFTSAGSLSDVRKVAALHFVHVERVEVTLKETESMAFPMDQCSVKGRSNIHRCDCPSVVPGPKTLASQGNSLEMQILRSQLRPSESETPERSPEIYFNKLPCDSDVPSYSTALKLVEFGT